MAIARTESTRKSVEQEYRYEHLTWPEINEAVAMKKAVVLPVGSTEQHGHHLPLDVDAKLSSSVVYEAARRAPADMLVLPPVAYGYCHHVMDFPGTINIEPGTFVKFLLDITRSVAYHGFKRIAVINGHGSNTPMIDLIARRTTLETPSLCCAFGYYNMGKDETHAMLESGTYAHADEWETSLYLHFDKARVQMDKAVKDQDRVGKTMTSDSTTNVRFNDYWGRWTKTGVHGDPTVATPEKGKKILEIVMKHMLEWLNEYREWPIEKRSDQHRLPVPKDIRW